MDCAEKSRLLEAYRKGTEMLLSSLDELSTRMGTVDKDEYERLRRITDENRMKAEQARLDMERHIADHRC